MFSLIYIRLVRGLAAAALLNHAAVPLWAAEPLSLLQAPAIKASDTSAPTAMLFLLCILSPLVRCRRSQSLGDLEDRPSEPPPL